jgi:hypothetical protein
MFIPDPESGLFHPGSRVYKVPDPGVKKAPDPGSRSATLIKMMPIRNTGSTYRYILVFVYLTILYTGSR